MGRLLIRIVFAALLAVGADVHAGSIDEAIASMQAAYARAAKPGAEADNHRELFTPLFQRVQRSYAVDVDVDALADAANAAIADIPDATGDAAATFSKAVQAALRKLDPYSRYIDMRSYANERSESSGAFGGVGLQLEGRDAGVRIVAVTPEGPAARAGIKAEDLIVRLDDFALAGVPLSEAVGRMRGAPGTPITLTVRREGSAQEITVSVVREEIKRQLLRASMEGDTLVLRLSTFTGPVTAELERAIAQATAKGKPRSVVLDLRGNTGGLLLEAIKTADLFLSEGVIVSLKGRTPWNQRTWNAEAPQVLAGLPMVVLVDARSASASELVAAALQENGRATVMGEKSYGKGTVQSTYPLGDGKGALKITTAHYYGPLGHSLNKTGLVPDIEFAGKASDGVANAKLRIEQARCGAGHSDAGVGCAVSFLASGGIDAFASAFADVSP